MTEPFPSLQQVEEMTWKQVRSAYWRMRYYHRRRWPTAMSREAQDALYARFAVLKRMQTEADRWWNIDWALRQDREVPSADYIFWRDHPELREI